MKLKQVPSSLQDELGATLNPLSTAMACIITLNLRESATYLEKVSHPSHNAWYKSLARLRDVGLDIPGTPTRDHSQKIAEYSYCCVDQENPQRVIYLYR